MIDRIPDAVVPALGWRGWFGHNDALRSPYLKTAWEPGPQRATCRASHLGGYFQGDRNEQRVSVRNVEAEPCACGAAHELVSSPPVDAWDRGRCRPVAYPLETAADRWGHGQFVDSPPDAIEYDDAHRTPGDGCTCGWYALHACPPVFDEGASFERCLVWGAVAGWGRLIVTHEGWRAEWASVVGLVGPDTLSSTAAVYGVPLAATAAELTRLISAEPLSVDLREIDE